MWHTGRTSSQQSAVSSRLSQQQPHMAGPTLHPLSCCPQAPPTNQAEVGPIPDCSFPHKGMRRPIVCAYQQHAPPRAHQSYVPVKPGPGYTKLNMDRMLFTVGSRVLEETCIGWAHPGGWRVQLAWSAASPVPGSTSCVWCRLQATSWCVVCHQASCAPHLISHPVQASRPQAWCVYGRQTWQKHVCVRALTAAHPPWCHSISPPG